MNLDPEVLIRYRRKLGLSQREVADAIGVSQKSYSYYEDGQRNPKYEKVIKLREVLQIPDAVSTNVPESADNPVEGEQITGGIQDAVNKEAESFLVARRNRKNKPEPFMVPFVPVKAQAGYVRAMDQSMFVDTMEKYAIPPGVDHHGAIWRYWEIEGDSMEPSFHSGDIVLTSQVHKMDWEQLRNFYLYVIVTEERVIFKRLYCMNPMEWVLISENEESYPQQILQAESVKEVWVYRRSIVNKAPVPKMYEITVKSHLKK